jgi:hypothetical protein
MQAMAIVNRMEGGGAMDSITDMDRLLRDVVEHLKSPKKSERRAATVKLRRIADIASTLALTLRSA